MKIQPSDDMASAVPMASGRSEGGSDVVSRSPMALPPQAIIRPAAGGRSGPCPAGFPADRGRVLPGAGPGGGRCGGPAPDALARLVEQAWPEVRAQCGAPAPAERTRTISRRRTLRSSSKRTTCGGSRPGRAASGRSCVTSLRHFLSNARDRARARKRGGHARTLSLEDAGAHARPCAGLVCASTPESLLASVERQRALRHAIATVAGEVRGEEEGRRLPTLCPVSRGERRRPRHREAMGSQPGRSPRRCAPPPASARASDPAGAPAHRPLWRAGPSRHDPPGRRESLSGARALPILDRRGARAPTADRG